MGETFVLETLHRLGVRRQHAAHNPIRSLTRIFTSLDLIPLRLLLDSPLDLIHSVQFPEASFKYHVTPGDALGARLYWQDWKHWEPYVVPHIARFAKQAVRMLDVGAHTGVYSLYACALNRELEVYCFEPMPTVYKRLVANIQLNGLDQRCKPMQTAVSQKAGIANFQITEDLTMCHLGNGGKSIEVPVVRLDDVVPFDQKVSFVKMDVEGHEHRALMGMTGLIERSHPVILFECNPGGQGHEIDTLLRQFGYHLFSIVNGVVAEIDELIPERFADGNHNFLALQP